MARALELAEPGGFSKALLAPDPGRLRLAMMGAVTCDQLRDAVFAHPTLAESLNTLFTTLES